MKANTISGQRQYAFVSQFNYIREAGTEGEEKAACRIEKELSEIAEKWGQGELQIRREPFEIETWQVDEAVFTVTEPYEKTYTVRGCFAAANTAPEGVEAPFLYVENGDPVSLSHAEGKIVLINGGANAENYEKLEKAGAVGFLILTGTPLDKDEDRLPDYRTLRGVKNPKLPCAVIHYLDAMELVERGASRARLVLQQKKIRRTSKKYHPAHPGNRAARENPDADGSLRFRSAGTWCIRQHGGRSDHHGAGTLLRRKPPETDTGMHLVRRGGAGSLRKPGICESA